MQRKEKHNRRYKKITVLLSLHNGFDISIIEEILGLDDNTIRRYLKQYKSVPLEDYLGNSYQGRKGLLSFEQEEELGEHLDQNLYGQVKPIIKYVESEYAPRNCSRTIDNKTYSYSYTPFMDLLSMGF